VRARVSRQAAIANDHTVVADRRGVARRSSKRSKIVSGAPRCCLEARTSEEYNESDPRPCSDSRRCVDEKVHGILDWGEQ